MYKKLFAGFVWTVFLCIVVSCSAPAEEDKNITDMEQAAVQPVSQETFTPAPAFTPLPQTTPSPLSSAAPAPGLQDADVQEVKIQAQTLLESMTFHEKICQLFFLRPEALTGQKKVTSAEDALRQALEAYPVGGLVYFGENIVTRQQVISMLENTRQYASFGIFLGVDEEGGTVARCGNNPNMGTTAFPPMMDIGDKGDTSAAYHTGLTIGSDLKELGFNLDFAPVADVVTNAKNTVIGRRAFGTDPMKTGEMVAEAVRGFQDSGVLSCLKHFPGHGNTTTDSHLEAAASGQTLEGLRTVEFLPFQSGINAGVPMVMVGHIALPEVTGSETPATFSYEIVTGLLREELGFTGICITDSLQMKAVSDTYTPGEAAVQALLAGSDMLLMPGDFYGAMEAVKEAVNRETLSVERIDESVLRILTEKIRREIIPRQQ